MPLDITNKEFTGYGYDSDNHTTIYKNAKTKVPLKDYLTMFNKTPNVIKPVKNVKLSKASSIITKGTFKGYKMFTLTLTERETCPKSCVHYLDCFGNNMPFAHRIDHTDQKLLEERIEIDLDELIIQKKKRVMLRLHILGDFFSVSYVLFWKKLLHKYNGLLAIFGYTGNLPNDPNPLYASIGKAIRDVRRVFKDRKLFQIRFSGMPSDSFSANSLDHNTPEKGKDIICPEQTGKTESCTTCSLCWDCPAKRILFITH